MEKVFKVFDGKVVYWDYYFWMDDFGSYVNIDWELMDMKVKFLKWNLKISMCCVIFEENGNLYNVQCVIVYVIVQNVVCCYGDFILIICVVNVF